MKIHFKLATIAVTLAATTAHAKTFKVLCVDAHHHIFAKYSPDEIENIELTAEPTANYAVTLKDKTVLHIPKSQCFIESAGSAYAYPGLEERIKEKGPGPHAEPLPSEKSKGPQMEPPKKQPKPKKNQNA